MNQPWQLLTGSCQVATYPHFCLEAADSSLHQQHVAAYHRPSREITLELWRRDGRHDLLATQEQWDRIQARAPPAGRER